MLAHIQPHCTEVLNTKKIPFPPGRVELLPSAPGILMSLPHHGSSSPALSQVLPSLPLPVLLFLFIPGFPPPSQFSVHAQRSGMFPFSDLPLKLSHLLHFHRFLPSRPTGSCSIPPQSIRAFPPLPVPQPTQPECGSHLMHFCLCPVVNLN